MSLDTLILKAQAYPSRPLTQQDLLPVFEVMKTFVTIEPTFTIPAGTDTSGNILISSRYAAYIPDHINLTGILEIEQGAILEIG